MKNGLTQYKGSLVVTSLPGGTTVTPRVSTSVSVTSGPILKGDKKRTVFLPWDYTVDKFSTFKGRNDYISDYIGAPQYWRAAYQSDIVQSADGYNYLADNLVDESASAYNKCLSRLYEKVRGSIDLSIDVIQTRQTVRMFNAVASIREYTRGRGWRALIGGASRARLEFVYGWKPLVTELYDSLDELTNVAINSIENFKTRAHVPVADSIITPQFQYQGGIRAVCHRKGSFTCEIGLRLKTRSHDPARWTSLNPVSMLYEATPYSFVLDWVYNLGGYIRDLETSLLYGNSFVSGYVTNGLFYDATCKASASRMVWNGGWPQYTYITDASASSHFRKMKRLVLTSMPVPRLPTFKAKLGADRLLNLASLLGVLIKVK